MTVLANGDLILPGRAIGLLLRFGLVGWDNFTDDSGPVNLSDDALASQDRLPYELQADLAGHIFKL